MTTVYTRAGKGSALTWTEGDANITNLNNDKIEDIVEDLTPQLGGNLDVNGNSIVSASNGDIVIAPNGTGSVIIDGNSFPQDQGVADQVLITDGAGQLSWSTTKTVHSLVYNADSVTINKGQVVYLFGANGANPSVKLALNTTDATSAKTYGIANESIAAGSTGEIVTQGLIKNVNTAAYAEGDTLYLGSTAGSLTATKPYGANHLVYVGVVTSVNSTSGRILVRVQNGYELDELHKVDIDHTQALASADYLTYNGTTGLWQNAPLAIEDDVAPILGGDLDVGGNSIVSTANGDIAITPNGTGKIVLDGLNWPTADGTADYVLKTDGLGQLSWVAQSAGGGIALDDLSVGAEGTASGDGAISYNNTTGVFTYTPPTAAGIGALANIVEDTTPQLGGNLDVNGNQIVSVSNGNISIQPNGTGQTIVKNIEYNENIYSLGTTSGTIAPDVANGNVQTITLNGNLTLNAFTNPVAGQSLTLIINTNGTNRTLTSSMLFAGASKTLSTTSTIDIISVFYTGSAYYASLSKGFA